MKVREISCRTIAIATGIPKNPYLDTLGTSVGQRGQKLENHFRFGLAEIICWTITIATGSKNHEK